MLFTFRKPTAATLQNFLEKHKNEPYSYSEVGDSWDKSPVGFDVDFNEIWLGTGQKTFDSAKIALQNWQQFPSDWCFIGGSEHPQVIENQLVTMSAQVLGTWWTNLARIVYVKNEARQFGFAYGTLRAHVERGEELFLVDWRADDSVWYSIRAFSQPKILPTKINYPFARDLQKRFVGDSRLAMRSLAGNHEKIDTGRSPKPHNNDLTHSKSMGYVSGWLLSLVGFLVWLVFLFYEKPSLLAAGWATSILLFAPLVACSLVFELVENRIGRTQISIFLRKMQLPAAILLTIAFLIESSIYQPILGVFWVILTGVSAIWGGFFILQKIKNSGWSANFPEITMAAGLVLSAIGGAWLMAALLNWQPMGFDSVIVFLTAIHFHFAGLILPVLAGLAARRFFDKMSKIICFGVLAGVPLTAIGITASQFQAGPWLEFLAASWMATAGILTAFLYLKLAFLPEKWRGKSFFAICAIALGLGMMLAFLYGIRSIFPAPGLTIPWMRALHGTLNSFGFAWAGLIGWIFLEKSSVDSNQPSDG
jgi:uncharacterized protein (UPF0548 family)/uncharacterized membrane protein YiaA